MTKVKLTEKQKELIEKAGVIFERDGFSPAAARTLSLLMVSDDTELTFEGIYQTLNMSKSAASNAINLLLVARRIEYITRPGERKRYFRTRLVQMESIYEEVFKDMDNEVAVYKEILAQRPDHTRNFNEGLRDFVSFMELVRESMPAIFQKWKKAKHK
jgi:DNA-binding transcriptional regulator GbsR (MarR family)